MANTLEQYPEGQDVLFQFSAFAIGNAEGWDDTTVPAPPPCPSPDLEDMETILAKTVVVKQEPLSAPVIPIFYDLCSEDEDESKGGAYASTVNGLCNSCNKVGKITSTYACDHEYCDNCFKSMRECPTEGCNALRVVLIRKDEQTGKRKQYTHQYTVKQKVQKRQIRVEQLARLLLAHCISVDEALIALHDAAGDNFVTSQTKLIRFKKAAIKPELERPTTCVNCPAPFTDLARYRKHLLNVHQMESSYVDNILTL